MAKIRNLNLDIIRCAAIVGVISIHFFLNSGFNDTFITGAGLCAGIFLKVCFLFCVPLFLLLTGYLMNKKQLTKKYYFGIIRILILYAVSTVLILLFKAIFLHEEFSVFNAVGNITSFQQYSWYIEMYIGLFLLIPFLNILYNNLSKKQKQILLLTLIFMTVLPTLLNIFGFQAAPKWWVQIYPLTYYFIGAYFSEFKDSLKISTKLNLLLLVLCIILFGVFYCIRVYGQKAGYPDYCQWYGFVPLTISVLLFNLLLNIKTNNAPKLLRTVITKIAEVSLTMYLVSWIFDQAAYPILNSAVPKIADRLLYFPIIVPAVFVCSFILAFIIETAYNLVAPKITRLIQKKLH